MVSPSTAVGEARPAQLIADEQGGNGSQEVAAGSGEGGGGGGGGGLGILSLSSQGKLKKHRRERKGSSSCKRRGKRRKKYAELEGERIAGLDRAGVYQPGSEDEEETVSNKQDNHILRTLFKKSGVVEIDVLVYISEEESLINPLFTSESHTFLCPFLLLLLLFTSSFTFTSSHNYIPPHFLLSLPSPPSRHFSTFSFFPSLSFPSLLPSLPPLLHRCPQCSPARYHHQ